MIITFQGEWVEIKSDRPFCLVMIQGSAVSSYPLCTRVLIEQSQWVCAERVEIQFAEDK
jgi:hypothetical protein